MAVPSRSGPYGDGDLPPSRRGGAAAGGYDAAVRGVAAARQRLEQGLRVLDRLVPLARRVSRVVGWYTAFVGVPPQAHCGGQLRWLWPS